MCKININQLVEQAQQIQSQVSKRESTDYVIADKLIAKAKELRKQADELETIASQLRVGLSDGEVAGRKTIVLKEGERHPKAPKPGRKPKVKTKKQRKITQADIDAMTPERREKYLANVERCRKMREAKQKNALVEHFAETKVS